MARTHSEILCREAAVEHMLDARRYNLSRQSTRSVALGSGLSGRVLTERIDAMGDIPAFDPSVLSSSTRATRADGFFLTDRTVETGDPVAVIPYKVVE
jgi:hypothetical protein